MLSSPLRSRRRISVIARLQPPLAHFIIGVHPLATLLGCWERLLSGVRDDGSEVAGVHASGREGRTPRVLWLRNGGGEVRQVTSGMGLLL